MYDPTVELSQKDERDWRAERREDIAAICWRECPDCNGHGYTGPHHWEAEDAGPDYIFQTDCGKCDHTGHIQLHDPLRVLALFDAADDARERMGVECYTRIASALSLAIDEAVKLSSLIVVDSASVPDKFRTVSYMAIWLVKAAEKKMAADEQFIREEKAYD